MNTIRPPRPIDRARPFIAAAVILLVVILWGLALLSCVGCRQAGPQIHYHITNCDTVWAGTDAGDTQTTQDKQTDIAREADAKVPIGLNP